MAEFKKPLRSQHLEENQDRSPDAVQQRTQTILLSREVGENTAAIAKETGLSEERVRKVIVRYEEKRITKTLSPEEQALESTRNTKRLLFVDKAYQVCEKLFDAAMDETKIAAAPLKDCITGLGILMDKILIATGKFEENTKTAEFEFLEGANESDLEKFLATTERSYNHMVERTAGQNGSGNTEGVAEQPLASRRIALPQSTSEQGNDGNGTEPIPVKN